MIVKTETREVLNAEAFIELQYRPPVAFVKAHATKVAFESKFASVLVKLGENNTFVRILRFQTPDIYQSYLDSLSEIAAEAAVVETELNAIMSAATSVVETI